MVIRFKKGFNLPITGEPSQSIEQGDKITEVALVTADFVGLKAKLCVAEGDRVKLGDVLLTDKKNPVICYTSPGCGVVKKIYRGDRRALLSIVIKVDGQDARNFQCYKASDLASLDKETIKDNLLKSGLWTRFRTRPFSKVPDPVHMPAAIFVNAMDTHPLAADPSVVILDAIDAYKYGISILKKMTAGSLYVCKKVGSSIPDVGIESSYFFDGPHPAGLVGTHIHSIEPVGANKTVWSIGYQDVIAIGRLFIQGRIDSCKIISLAGPQVKNPRLVRTYLGASVKQLTHDELKPGTNRVISGSVFGGRTAEGATAYLGDSHQQIVVLEEGLKRTMLHYLRAGFDRFSVLPIYVSHYLKKKNFLFTTTTNGSERAMVPIGNYERVMPLDILPTQLLRALVVGDIETSVALGALELEEEDLALCTFVCSGKYEYGPILRQMLTRIEKEG